MFGPTTDLIASRKLPSTSSSSSATSDPCRASNKPSSSPTASSCSRSRSGEPLTRVPRQGPVRPAVGPDQSDRLGGLVPRLQAIGAPPCFITVAVSADHLIPSAMPNGSKSLNVARLGVNEFDSWMICAIPMRFMVLYPSAPLPIRHAGESTRTDDPSRWRGGGFEARRPSAVKVDAELAIRLIDPGDGVGRVICHPVFLPSLEQTTSLNPLTLVASESLCCMCPIEPRAMSQPFLTKSDTTSDTTGESANSVSCTKC